MLETMTASFLKKLSAPGNEPGLEIKPEMFEKLLATDGAASDCFGYSVAISGDGSTVVIGAFRDDDKGTDTGSVYIFTKQADGSYLETQKLLASDGAMYDYFGYNVAVSNTSVVIGAAGHLGKGAAYVY